MTWLVRAVAAAAVVVVGWALVTGWGAIVHGFPLYLPLLLGTVVAAVVIGLGSLRPRPARSRAKLITSTVLILLAIGWIALLAWLRPASAVEPALSAMRSDAAVTVTETPTRIMITPTGSAERTGLFFQPGAKVDARAYAAVLRPVAESGHPVVIIKQPLGIAFLALPSFDSTRSDHPEIERWVVGGHSLGGTVAAMQADSGRAAGLLFYASYPADDLSTSLRAAVLSLSGSKDGLATPAKIAASRAELPADSTFTVIEGASHSSFGDYGAQRGDGVPTISHDAARQQISDSTVEFVAGLP